jgi:hypothetical protein
MFPLLIALVYVPQPACLGMKWKGDKIGVAMKAELMGMLLVMLAGWMNRHHQDVIVYVKVKTII